ncbi:MAG: NAD(P)H-hydrate dehydratase [Gammaproteobacteria bacterium]|nr:NAD(P)H-hydrate dehydratase [Gammaproteobacteria bacterium]
MSEYEFRLYSVPQVREIERRAIQQLGIAGSRLMRRAATAVWEELRATWPDAETIGVVCGPGNNGGDGFEVARLAKAARRQVRVWQVGRSPDLGDAAAARAEWLKVGGQVEPFKAGQDFGECDVLVDALFGVGLARDVEGDALAAIRAMNESLAVRLAVDVPSGLDADRGRALGATVYADRTVTFIGDKQGFYQGEGPEAVGHLVLHTLELQDAAYQGTPWVARLLDRGDLSYWLPPRPLTAHKGSHGHVLVVGGDHGYLGAAVLAARGALRGGAGLVTLATRAGHAAAIAAAQPEIMARGVETALELNPLLERASVVALGPGLGMDDWGRAMFGRVLSAKKPVVLDADGLNWLAQNPLRREDWVLTPHPGEAARLLGLTTAGVQADRFGEVRQLRERYGGVAVLKGANTLVCADEVSVCPYGNPGMAVGGMGDVLCGLIAALIAQGLPAATAAQAGVMAHALAGDAAAEEGERGLQPGDVLAALRKIVNP